MTAPAKPHGGAEDAPAEQGRQRTGRNGSLPRSVAETYGRSSTKPAASKSPSKASTLWMRLARMNAKLVASTNENSRSS